MPDFFWGIAYDTLQRCSAKMQKDLENNAFQEKTSTYMVDCPHLCQWFQWLVDFYPVRDEGPH